MRKLLILAALLCFAPFAHAAGGTCPSGANYGPNRNQTLSAIGVTSCFYVAATGSDSNDGLSEASGHPWLHAPGMVACTGTCASTTPAAGEGFILRGGDTWHYGNSGASPFMGAAASCIGAMEVCPWSIAWAGSNGSPIYFGYDISWFSGGSFARVIINGDNAPSSVGVSSCAHDESNFVVFSIHGEPYIDVDNFEFTGLCWSGAQQTATGFAVMIDTGEYSDTGQGNDLVTNNYLHGWSHVTFSCSSGPTGNCDAATGIGGPSLSTYGGGDQLLYNVFDGSDTDEESLSDIIFGGYEIGYNYFGHTGNALVTNNTHSLHDNLFEDIAQSGDDVSHTNVFEFNFEWAANNTVYNNLIRNSFTDSGSGEFQQMAPGSGATDWYFDNLVYGLNSNGNYFDFCGGSEVYSGCGYSGATIDAFNNTWVMQAAGAVSGPATGSTLNFINNHCINLSGSPASNCIVATGSGVVNYTTNTVQTPTAATAQGYTSSQTYAYSPTSGGSTIGAGTNEQSICTAIGTADGGSDPQMLAAETACQNGTGYACVYNATTHAVSCPALTLVARPASTAWDAGAYQFSSGGSAGTPTASPSSGTYTGTQSVTLSVTGGAPVICWNTTGSPATNGTTGCATGTLYTTAISVSSSETIYAIAGGTGYTDGSVGSFAYVITAGATGSSLTGGLRITGGITLK